MITSSKDKPMQDNSLSQRRQNRRRSSATIEVDRSYNNMTPTKIRSLRRLGSHTSLNVLAQAGQSTPLSPSIRRRISSHAEKDDRKSSRSRRSAFGRSVSCREPSSRRTSLAVRDPISPMAKSSSVSTRKKIGTSNKSPVKHEESSRRKGRSRIGQGGIPSSPSKEAVLKRRPSERRIKSASSRSKKSESSESPAFRPASSVRQSGRRASAMTGTSSRRLIKKKLSDSNEQEVSLRNNRSDVREDQKRAAMRRSSKHRENKRSISRVFADLPALSTLPVTSPIASVGNLTIIDDNARSLLVSEPRRGRNSLQELSQRSPTSVLDMPQMEEGSEVEFHEGEDEAYMRPFFEAPAADEVSPGIYPPLAKKSSRRAALSRSQSLKALHHVEHGKLQANDSRSNSMRDVQNPGEIRSQESNPPSRTIVDEGEMLVQAATSMAQVLDMLLKTCSPPTPKQRSTDLASKYSQPLVDVWTSSVPASSTRRATTDKYSQALADISSSGPPTSSISRCVSSGKSQSPKNGSLRSGTRGWQKERNMDSFCVGKPRIQSKSCTAASSSSDGVLPSVTGLSRWASDM